MMAELISSLPTILGFGFLGLAFLMAYFAHDAFKKVLDAPSAKPDVIKLAKHFMYMSLAFLVCAGPLQFGLLYAQKTFSSKDPIQVTISLANTGWLHNRYGEVGIIKGGGFKPFSDKALNETLADGSEIIVQLDKVLKFISNMEAQLLVSNSTGTRTNNGIFIPKEASDTAAEAVNGG